MNTVETNTHAELEAITQNIQTMSRFTSLLRPIAGRQAAVIAVPSSSSLSSTRFISTTPIIRSTMGYGDPSDEGANNTGTKTPATSPNPMPAGSGRKGGATDTEGGVKNSGTASKGTPASGGSKRVGTSGGQEPLPEAKSAMGQEGGGKTGPPSEEKKIGEAPRKTGGGEDSSQQTQER